MPRRRDRATKATVLAFLAVSIAACGGAAQSGVEGSSTPTSLRRPRRSHEGACGDAATCVAAIVGGWEREHGDIGYFGVRLYLPASP